MKEWIIVASRAEAKIFSRINKQQSLKYIKTLENKKGRRKERDFESDRPGVSYAKFSLGFAPHNLEGQHSHAETVAKHFAHTIAKFIKLAYQQHEFSRAFIFADAKLLGKIKNAFKESILPDAFIFINKNIEKESSQDIANHLPENF